MGHNGFIRIQNQGPIPGGHRIYFGYDRRWFVELVGLMACRDELKG